MAPRRIEVFFYELFMDADLLHTKGSIRPTSASLAFLASCCVLWASLTALSQTAGSNPEAAPGKQTARGGQIIPFELYDNFPFLQVRVNGSEPRSFLLDTGASTSLLNQTLAHSLGLGPKHLHETAIGTGESSTRLGFAKRVVLSLASVDLPAQTVAVVPLADLESRIGHAMGGIVGADLFKRYVVTIDYAAKRITLNDPKTFAYHGGGELITIRVSGNRPFFKANLTPVCATPIEAELVIDTGDSSTIAFHTPFVEKHNLRAPTQKLVPHVSRGVSGESRNWRGRVSSLQIGKFEIHYPIATFSEATKGSEADRTYDGVLGGEILRRFSVTLDYSRHQMFLESNSALNEPYDTDMSGATLVAPGPDFGIVTVESVRDGSAASEAGLKPLDLIETVDDKTVRDFSLQQIKQLFMQDGAQYVLGVRRGKEVINLTIRIHRLI